MKSNAACTVAAPSCIDTSTSEANRKQFNRQAFEINHQLSDHPLFSIDRLLELAKNMSPADLYYDAGDIKIGQRWNEVPPCELSIDQLLDRIENSGAWIILRKVHKYPEYDRLVAQCLSECLDLVDEPLRRQIAKREGIIFISSPLRIATYHIDRECSFLLQIHGEKEISIFDKFDREVITEEEIERFWTVDNNAATYKEQYQDRASFSTDTGHRRPHPGRRTTLGFEMTTTFPSRSTSTSSSRTAWPPTFIGPIIICASWAWHRCRPVIPRFETR